MEMEMEVEAERTTGTLEDDETAALTEDTTAAIGDEAALVGATTEAAEDTEAMDPEAGVEPVTPPAFVQVDPAAHFW
jgi:hypothetical protein